MDPDVAKTDQPYLFTNDNPLNSEDPLGLWQCSAAVKKAHHGSCPAGYSSGGPKNMDFPQPAGSELTKLKDGNYGLWLADGERFTITPKGVILSNFDTTNGVGAPPHPNSTLSVPGPGVFKALAETANTLTSAIGGFVAGSLACIWTAYGALVCGGAGFVAGGYAAYKKNTAVSDNSPPSYEDLYNPNFYNPDSNLEGP